MNQISKTMFYSNPKIQIKTPHPIQPFVLYGAGGSGKSALLSKTALQSLKVTIEGGGSRLKINLKRCFLLLGRNGSLRQCPCSCVAIVEQHQTPQPWVPFSSKHIGSVIMRLILLQGLFVSRSPTPTCFPLRTSRTIQSL